MRRILIVLVAAFIASSAFSFQASAAEDTEVIKGSIVNPLYEDIIDTSLPEKQHREELEPKGADIQYLASYDFAVQYVRQKFVGRSECFELNFTVSDEAYSDDVLASVLYDAANVYTGIQNEGEYIAYHISRVGYEGVLRKQCGRKYISVEVCAEYLTTVDQENKVVQYIDAAMDELKLYNLSDYEKAKRIYDYICKNVKYTVTGDCKDETNTAYGAIVNKKASAQGYMCLVYRMMIDAGLDCRCISGIAKVNGKWKDHGWNIVRIGNKYYNVDATLDEGQDEKKYFLVSNNFIGHERDAEYSTSEFNSEHPMAADNYAACTSVEIDSDKLAILTTDSPVRLTAKCYPENAVNKDITWTSLNPGFVTVDSDGNIKAKNISSTYAVGTIRAENPATGCFDEVKVHIYNPSKMKNDFNSIKNAAILTKYTIPDLNAGYCPQGLCMNSKYVFVSAYNEKKEYTSAIYIFNRNTGELLNKAYLDTVSHVGGIAYDPVSKYIVVCANESLTKKVSEKKKLNFYTVDKLLNAKTWCPLADYKKTIDFTGSFVTAYDGKIWVGNFNKKKSTPLKTYKYNKATKKYVFVKKYTMKIKSVQGICFTPNGQMLVSASSGRDYSSKLYKAKKSLTGYKATHRAYIPNLSQNIVCNKTNGTTYTYVLYESAYNKYMYDSSQKVLRPVDRVMRINYNKIKWTKL